MGRWGHGVLTPDADNRAAEKVATVPVVQLNPTCFALCSARQSTSMQEHNDKNCPQSVRPGSQLLLGSSCTLPLRPPVSCTAYEQSRVCLSGLRVDQHRLGRGHGRQVNLHTPQHTRQIMSVISHQHVHVLPPCHLLGQRGQALTVLHAEGLRKGETQPETLTLNSTILKVLWRMLDVHIVVPNVNPP